MAYGEPFIADPKVLTHAELQSLAHGGFAEHTDHVLTRPHIHRIPAGMLGIPEVEIVVMDTHADEVLRASLLVELNEVIGVELVAFPGRDNVLKTEFTGVTVGGNVVLVLLATLHVHVAGIPVAGFGSGLRTPMGPNAKLRIAEPLGNLILLQGVTGSLERSCGFGKTGRDE